MKSNFTLLKKLFNGYKNMDELIKQGYTRVTEPLQGFSKYDMIDPEVLANAADRGTRAHKFCEMHAKGLLFSDDMVDDDCKNYVKCFRQWFDDNVKEVVFTEKRFYNDEYMITGQIDMMVFLSEWKFPVLVDIKTTSNIGLSWSLQTAAYRYISESEYPLCSRMALNLPKTGNKVKIIEYNDYENDLRMYLNCLELYRYLNPPKKVKEIDFSVA